MNYEDINYNEVLISETINNIKKLNNFITFGLTCLTFSNIKSKCFINFHIYEDLYNTYKDLFFKDNKIVSYAKVTEVSNNKDDIVNGRRKPCIRYDEDGVMVWDGKRCELTKVDENNPDYLEVVEFLKEFE